MTGIRFTVLSVHECAAARKTRITGETEITVELSLDGEGKTEISTGLGFFDHMLDQLGRHGGLDLVVKATGDLHVDEHHTIEDTAITLGEAFREALGNKRGIERYAFVLPMDDSLATVALDFGGRPWMEWNVKFKREMIGDVPTEMFFHFFKSFSDAARCNLNIKAEGNNEHHKIEAVFKGFARAIKMAVKLDPDSQVSHNQRKTCKMLDLMNVAIIKYNAGNIRSVDHALKRLGVSCGNHR